MLYIKLLYSEKEENNLLKSFFVIKLTRNSAIHWMDDEGIYVREVNQKTRINLYHIHRAYLSGDNKQGVDLWRSDSSLRVNVFFTTRAYTSLGHVAFYKSTVMATINHLRDVCLKLV